MLIIALPPLRPAQHCSEHPAGSSQMPKRAMVLRAVMGSFEERQLLSITRLKLPVRYRARVSQTRAAGISFCHMAQSASSIVTNSEMR